MARRTCTLMLLGAVTHGAHADEPALTFEARLARAPVTQEAEPEIDLAGVDEDWNALMRHRGFVWRVGGMILDVQNDALRTTGEPIEFGTGGGVSVAAGYRFAGFPWTVELEYAYRGANADDRRFDRDADIDLHTITANALFDQADVLGPVGVYAGAGLGVRIQEFRYSSVDGRSTTEISGTSFFWQARAGVTLSLSDRMQLYGGLIWSDAGDLDDVNVYVDTEMLGAEFGFRFFF